MVSKCYQEIIKAFAISILTVAIWLICKAVADGPVGPVLARPTWQKQSSILHKARNKQKFQGYFWPFQACYIIVQQIEKLCKELENYRPPTHAISEGALL